MDRQRDLELILKSSTPLVVIETRDESGMLAMLQSISLARTKDAYLPLFRWTITDGLQRLDIALEPQLHNAKPTDVLRHIRAVTKPGIYVLLDFHPYLQDPVNVRLLKDICLRFAEVPRQLVLVSHQIEIPDDLRGYSARFEMALPTEKEREEIVRRAASQWASENPGSRVSIDPKAYRLLIQNLAGLTDADTERLARNAIYSDGAISKSDLPAVMQAKYELLNSSGILRYEYDTAKFADVGGLQKLKKWLLQRKAAFLSTASGPLDAPKGVLLIGIQGCGKSLAAKASAGVFEVPLLRLDFGALYNKYHGETERNLRETLKTADVMTPCVLWVDEIEKGIAGRDSESGTSQRVLATFLTWLAEKKNRVFVVATANDISALPPELVRKGRFDEIFFVDLPSMPIRAEIAAIHLANRGQARERFDLKQLAEATEGFSGAEIEQAVVSALYEAHSEKQPLATSHLLQAIRATRPLSVVMAENVAALRHWSAGRTVSSD
ncbi:MAG TPA: AAA family ATPase [Woeseiaceae bacterium]|nr:AAA family ATPase [Woeseiaceae bacterium]